MKHLIGLLFSLFVFQTPLTAQQDVIIESSKTSLIRKARLQLDTAFLYDDLPTASLWMDSLTQMEDENYVGLVWDEQWLLYYWSGLFSNVLDEASRYDADKRQQQSWKTQPPNDSLFDHLDRTLLARQYNIFAEIERAFLNEEEKAFATLLLEYLLRTNTDRVEWNTKIENFLKKYPSSRFSTYLRSIKPHISKAGKSAFGLFVTFKNGQWLGEMERTARPLNSLEFGLSYWRNRFNCQLALSVGSSRLDRDVFEGGFVWPKGETYASTMFYLEAGYDVINKPKIRIFPTIGGGFNGFRPTTPEDDEDPNPDYYELFRYPAGHLQAVLNVDLKWRTYNTGLNGIPGGSYHGPRIRVGYQWTNRGRQNPALGGNLFFLAVGYSLFTMQEVGGYK